MNYRIFVVMMFNPLHICSPDIDFRQSLHEVFHYQIERNHIYRNYIEGLESEGLISISNILDGVKSDAASIHEIMPLIPVEAFRDSKVYTEGEISPGILFRSSGTSTSVRSTHYVAYKQQYIASIFQGFKFFYPLEEYVILAYTPGYNSNPHSSLVWMLHELIKNDRSEYGRFLEIGQRIDPGLIDRITRDGKKIMLFGAAFGLIEMAETFPVELPGTSIIMETGGMKTYRKEMTREELHQQLASGFGLEKAQIHSEYGMAELLSQAYADGSMWFKTPPWMKVTIRNPYNPIESMPAGEEGLVGIIDLANWASCPFILTGDAGVQRGDGAFQVNGRWSKYHLRGCNFLLEAD